MPLSSRPGSGVPTIESEPWLTDPRLQRLMRAIAGADEEIRVVGGAVRNALIGRAVSEVDLATTATPKTVIERTRHRNMRAIPTGIDHGTVTVLVDGQPFEVTTLREDVETDGRHAIVKFGRDWTADAMRRDFTVNALYATANGEIIDLVGGIADCQARRIRFIGDPEARIREDYLRILRLFRFHATISDGPIDSAGLAAAVALQDGLSQLSAERIGQEILKLVAAEHAPDVITVMRNTGILERALGVGVTDVGCFGRLHAALLHLVAKGFTDLPTAPATLLLASLAEGSPERAADIARRLRVSNATRDRMIAAVNAAPLAVPDLTDRLARALIFRLGRDVFCDRMLLAACVTEPPAPIGRIESLLRLAASFVPPKLPISGRDLQAHGLTPGPELGALRASLQEAWIASDFKLTRDELLGRLPHRAP